MAITNTKYKGVIIEESLEKNDILKDVIVVDTKVEPVTEDHKTPWIKQWTLHTIEIPEEKADEVADKLSADKNPVLYKDAKQYGISLGIPEYQVDFAPEDKVWER